MGPTMLFHCFLRFCGELQCISTWVLRVGYLINQTLIKSHGYMCVGRVVNKVSGKPWTPKILTYGFNKLGVEYYKVWGCFMYFMYNRGGEYYIGAIQ